MLALVPAGHSVAANVLWGAPAAISGDTDVSTAGTLLYAFNFGDSGVPSATVNGVTFAPFPAPNSGKVSASAGTVTLLLMLGADFFRSTLTETGSTMAPFSNLTAAYRGLLQSNVSDGVNPSHMTLNLRGLTIGNSYEFQFWSNESTSFTNLISNDTRTLLTAGNAVSLDGNTAGFTGGLGQWVIGNFTADAAFQDIDITGANPDGASPILTAFQLRTVPEPASLSLLAIAAVLAGRCRCRCRH